MTQDKSTPWEAGDEHRLGITRRGILRTSAALGAFGIFGVPAMGSVAAQTGETLYLTDSGIDTNDDLGTKLFRVDLDDTNGVANLTLLAELNSVSEGSDWYDQVDALAASPDGSTVYAIDKFSKHLGIYDVDTDAFSDVGMVSGLPNDVVQAAFSPDGVLYVSSDSGDDLYVVNPSQPAVTKTINFADNFGFQGADIVFAADGTLYIFTNEGDSNGLGLYKVDDISTATEPVSPTFIGAPDRPYFTGLAIRNGGTGNLVASAHTYDTSTSPPVNSDGTGENDVSRLFTLDPFTGSKLKEYDTKLDGSDYYLGYGDMTVGQLAPTTTTTTLDLCAGQDIDVGTVTITQSVDELKVTYNLTGGWLLYETHVDVANSFEGLPTNKPGNPQVGQFDHSMTHDGITEYSYAGDCDYWGVNADGDYLYVAIHAVVKPADGCVDFGALEPGDSVEGLGTVNPVLNIQSGYGDGSVLMSVDGSDPFYYGSDEDLGVGGGRENGCLDPAGFADIVSTDASGQNRPHKYVFTVADDVTLSDFSLRMLDFGDYTPNKAGHHYAEMVAYDAGGNVVDTHELEYWSDGKSEGTVNPHAWSWEDPNNGGTLAGNLQDAGDACNATEGEPGNWVWSVEGDGIVRVELTCGEGYDPNIAFTDLCFTANDETAWPCVDQDGVERFVDKGNWATYVTVEPFIDCS